jgi:aminoglycoside 6'-N-acetyltransferase
MAARPVEITFRPLRRPDFALLASWLATPHVAEFWREDSTAEAVEAAYGPMVDGEDPTEGFVAELDGHPVGFVQRYLIADYPQWQAAVGGVQGAGIDYLIGVPGLTGIGLGPLLVARFSALTFDRYPQADTVTVAVAQANRRSWRALEKAGFTRVLAGTIDSGDPSDEGPSYLYVRRRPTP